MQALLNTDAILVESFVGPGDERSLADDVLDGLTRPFKELPPKHFYDARGGELFDRITELPEYYPTCACTASSATSSATSATSRRRSPGRGSSRSSAARSATSRLVRGGASCG